MLLLLKLKEKIQRMKCANEISKEKEILGIQIRRHKIVIIYRGRDTINIHRKLRTAV